MKNSNLKFYASACGGYHGNFLKPLGFVEVKEIEDADLVIFGGGADVDPETYGAEPGSRTYPSPQREREEKKDFETAKKLGKKMFGICRGHQFLCAMAGGKLIQDVTNHSGTHEISTFDGSSYKTNSIHHQMINPYNMKSNEDYKILAWTTKRLSKRYLGEKDKPVYLPYEFKEIEAVYFPKIRAAGVQYHPEMMYRGSADPAVEWTQSVVIKLMNNQL